MSTSFGSVKPLFNLSSILSDMDTTDLYEGGRYKRKRNGGGGGGGDSDYDSDPEESSRKQDPNAFDSNLAKFRTKLIR